MNQPLTTPSLPPEAVILANVRAALEEDIGSGDITAALIPAHNRATARVITREPGILCGRAWVDGVFREIDSDTRISWRKEDGEEIAAGEELFTLRGTARNLLTGEATTVVLDATTGQLLSSS